jgi:hypothetical protein
MGYLSSSRFREFASHNKKSAFEEIDVRRINIVEQYS